MQLQQTIEIVMRVVRSMLIVFGMIFGINSFAQDSSLYGSGLKLNLNTQGTKYVRFQFNNQILIRSIDNNPGTAVANEPASSSFDIGARRVRAIVYAQVSPRYFLLLQFGMNNQTFINGGNSVTTTTGPNGAGKKPSLFLHDFWNEYTIIPQKNPLTGKPNKFSISAGAGLHYWNGVSRLTSASTSTFLMIDAPGFNWPTLEMSDQLIRQFGMYAKGNYAKLHYQISVNKPFATNVQPAANGVAVDNNGNPKPSFAGYFDYQFLDQESNLLPYRTGTYLGAKKVLNIGAGFFTNKDATKYLSKNNQLNKHDMQVFAADVFADLPVGDKSKNMALTVYSAIYKYDMGPNYIRTAGTMNIGTADSAYKDAVAQEGFGNARYTFGTGNIWYIQAGFLLPKQLIKHVRIQPMLAYTLKNLQALNESGHYYDIGTNILIDEHHAKLTLQYSSRPLYHQNNVFTRKGEWLLQLQICI